MRLANLAGRLVLLHGARALDVQQASGGRFGSDPMAAYDDWTALLDWAGSADLAAGTPYDATALGAPVPRPRQVFAVALNYRPHAAEAGWAAPEVPLVFTKFPSCLTGPTTTVALPPGDVDWELELVVVIGQPACRVAAADAWGVVAGLTVGQDLSERQLQLRGAPPQFSLAKSHPGFGPIGPALVTLDEVDDPDDLELTCVLSGERVQHARTSEMIFPVAQLVEFLSAVCPLLPGDLVFTGTPAGVGNRRTPPRFLQPGDELVSMIGGLGTMTHSFRS